MSLGYRRCMKAVKLQVQFS